MWISRRKRSSLRFGERIRSPSCSIGFRVAKTWKGSGRRCVVVPTVTRRSCIAWSSAACVLGGVRLISSARTKVVEDRAGEEPHSPAGSPLPVVFFLQDVGAGDVGGEQIRRELDAAEAEVERLCERRDEQRLGEPPRHADEERMPACARSETSIESTTFSWPTTRAPIASCSFLFAAAAASRAARRRFEVRAGPGRGWFGGVHLRLHESHAGRGLSKGVQHRRGPGRFRRISRRPQPRPPARARHPGAGGMGSAPVGVLRERGGRASCRHPLRCRARKGLSPQALPLGRLPSPCSRTSAASFTPCSSRSRRARRRSRSGAVSGRSARRSLPSDGWAFFAACALAFGNYILRFLKWEFYLSRLAIRGIPKVDMASSRSSPASC